MIVKKMEAFLVLPLYKTQSHNDGPGIRHRMKNVRPSQSHNTIRKLQDNNPRFSRKQDLTMPEYAPLIPIHMRL